VMEQYPEKVRIVIKQYPLTRIHKYAEKAAKAALAADRQGKFREFHSRLFRNQKGLNNEVILGIAERLDMDMERFERDLNSPDIALLIERDRSEAKRIGVKSVPSVFVNGRLLRDRSLQGFREMIERELERKRGRR